MVKKEVVCLLLLGRETERGVSYGKGRGAFWEASSCHHPDVIESLQINYPDYPVKSPEVASP